MNIPIARLAGQYREWRPSAALTDHISHLWVHDFSRSSAMNFLVVPDGSVDILWTGEHLLVAGPDTRPILEAARAGSRIVGVRFRPGVAYAWLRAPLSEARNARIPLNEFWKQDADLFADRLLAAPRLAAIAALQQALLVRLPQVGEADSRINFLRMSAGTFRENLKAPRTRDLAREAGMSERTLHRHCTEVFGYGFKTLQRILRFQGLLRLVGESSYPNLPELAIKAGFADQSHMSREVRRLCSATPGKLVSDLSR